MNMKKILFTLTAALLVLGMASCGKKAENTALTSETDSLSWAMGMSLAQTANSGFCDFDQELVRKAFESTLKGEKQPLDEASFYEATQKLALLATMKSREQADAAAQKGQAEDARLFAQLEKEHPDVKKTESGLCYEVLREGHGPKAKAGLRIQFDFKGTYMSDGSLIEQTYGVREPITHTLSSSIFPGLYEGLQLMTAGSQFRFYIPSNLVKNANNVEPNRAVVYEVELHEIYKD